MFFISLFTFYVIISVIYLTFTALFFCVVRYWWCLCDMFSVSVILLATLAVEVDFDELWDICRGFKWQSIHVITHLII